MSKSPGRKAREERVVEMAQRVDEVHQGRDWPRRSMDEALDDLSEACKELRIWDIIGAEQLEGAEYYVTPSGDPECRCKRCGLTMRPKGMHNHRNSLVCILEEERQKKTNA